MDFRKETRGENATKAVEQVACFYDNAIYEKDGKVVAQYAEIWGHPDSEIGKNQTNLALVSERQERNGKTTFNHSISLYPNQVQQILEVAGDNVAPLLDKNGNKVGTIVGYKSDLMRVERNGKVIGLMPNTKTLQPSDLSVAEVDGKDIRSRIFEAMREAKVAKGEKVAPQVQAEAPQVEQAEPELV